MAFAVCKVCAFERGRVLPEQALKRTRVTPESTCLVAYAVCKVCAFEHGRVLPEVALKRTRVTPERLAGMLRIPVKQYKFALLESSRTVVISKRFRQTPAQGRTRTVLLLRGVA